MNLFELFIKIGVDNKEAINGLDETGKEVEKTGGKLSGFTNALGNGLKTAAKIGTAAVTAAATGVTALTTAAVKNYADYEQLVGGVETLFKESSDKVIGYAENAYKTAGLSANSYMETVTSFSASLLQSLGGDTEEAAEKADMAITDMSDNANKMGTTMESIQNAYQGFAKQNYTMLDNLKLGYGGTKEEMERLLEDAEAISGIEYDVKSFADIVDAIHIIQTEMGITGTTAEEANETISGSLNMTKAAFSNLITGIADENADFSELISDVVFSVTKFGENIIPRIEIALNGIGTLIEEVAPIIIEKLPSLVDTLLPKAIEAIGTIIESIAEVLPSLVDTLVTVLTNPETISSFMSIITSLITALSEAIPDIINAILVILPTIITELGKSLGKIIPSIITMVVKIIESLANNIGTIIQAIVEAIPTIIESLTEALKENFPALLQGIITLVLQIIENLPSIIQMIAEEIGPLVSTIVEVIVSNLPMFIQGIAQIVFEIIKALPQILASLGTAVFNIFSGIGTGLANAWPKFKEGLGNIWNNIANWFGETSTKVSTKMGEIFDNVIQWFKDLPGKIGYWLGFALGKLARWAVDAVNWAKEEVPKIPGKVAEFFKELPGKVWNAITGAITDFGQWASDFMEKVKEEVPKIPDKIKSYFDELPDKLKKIGEDFINGFWDGVTTTWNTLTTAVSNFCGGIVQGFKDAFGIKSPSKVMKEQVGKNIALGLKDGLDEYSPLVVDSAESMSDDLRKAIDTDYDMTLAVSTVTEPYKGEDFETTMTNAIKALVSVEESRKVDVNVSVDAADSEVGRLLLKLINVTAKEVYA